MKKAKKNFYHFLFYRILGWQTKVSIPFYDKCVICVAPHTSNWDFLIGELFYRMHGIKGHFMMKKEWFFFPLGYFFRAIGGIPVDRQRKTSLVEQMSHRFETEKTFSLAITPEATRKANAEWKKGFYYIALNAKVPLVLAALDYRKKTVYWERLFTPGGDIEQDMAEIKRYFSQFAAKHPERFTTGH